MNRRTFLRILGAAGVAVVVAPKAVLARALVPAKTLPLASTAGLADGLQTIRIGFPDGSVWSMRGFVTSQFVNSSIDGVVTSTVEFRPSGPCECAEENAALARVTQGKQRANTTRGTSIQLDGRSLGEVSDIALPRMERAMFEVTSDGLFDGEADLEHHYIAGLKRVSPMMTFTVNFAEALLNGPRQTHGVDLPDGRDAAEDQQRRQRSERSRHGHQGIRQAA